MSSEVAIHGRSVLTRVVLNAGVEPCPSWPAAPTPAQCTSPAVVSAQLVSRPRAAWLKRRAALGGAARTGVELTVDWLPVPSCPLLLGPQQYNAPPIVTAQLCSA